MFNSRSLSAGLAAAVLATSMVGGSSAASAPTRSAKPSDLSRMLSSNTATVQPGVVDPAATQALKKMSQYLMSLATFQIDTDGSIDMVTSDGQRIQLDGTTTYKVRKPGFAIHFVSDIKSRDFYYDGRQFTIFAPNLGYYATVPAPPTNRQVLDDVYDKFGIRLPLEDLFRWNDIGNDRINSFKSATVFGPATIDGVKTTHYAFREPNVDWEVWIQDGDQPLPRKLSIVDRTDPARPTFTTRLKWTVNPTFSDSDFTFTPGSDAKKIQLATFER